MIVPTYRLKHQFLFFLSSATLFSRTIATVSTCMTATEFLNRQNFKLKSASDEMWTEFDDSCKDLGGCPLDMEEIFTTTNLDFDALIGTDEYKALENACEDMGSEEFPTTLCRASSELLLYNGEQSDDKNGDEVDDFYIKNEPVCFPFQCGRKQISLFHDSPLGCDPETMNCIVYHLDDAVCPERQPEAGIGNCVKYSKEMNDREDFKEAEAALQAAAGVSCIKGKLQPNNNDVCQMESKPVKITLGRNFQTFDESVSYKNFMSACSEADGLTCHISALVTMKGQTGFINMDLTGDYNDYPMCLPKSCSAAEREVITTKRIGDEIVLEINKIVEQHARRHLLSKHDVDFEGFPLRQLDEDMQCPFKGLEECNFLVSDFYCVEAIDPSMQLTSSSAITTINTGSFVAAMAAAGGMLL